MKNILTIFLFLIILVLETKAQFTLEHTYPNASTIGFSGNQQQLYIINLEVDGEKYVHVDRLNKTLTFYNLNHTFWKTISYAAATDLNPSANGQSLMYISQHLFDLDDEIEVLYCDGNGPTQAITQIVNEDGSILYTFNNSFPAVLENAPQVQLPIYNTAAGTKLVLSLTDSTAQVWGLSGTLSSIIIPNPFEQTNHLLMYPNPSAEKVIIDNTKHLISYIIVSDEKGKKMLSIEDTSDNLIEINVSSFASGLYFIQAFDKRDILLETKKALRQ
jgi:hypothetical protein